MFPVLMFDACFRKVNIRKSPGRRWDTRLDKQGSTGRCPKDLLLFALEKRTEKGIFAGTPAGCRWDTRPFTVFYVIFSYVPFLLRIVGSFFLAMWFSFCRVFCLFQVFEVTV